MAGNRFALAYCLYDDHQHLAASLRPLIDQVDLVLFLMSEVPWNGAPSDNRETRQMVQKICAEHPHCKLLVGNWSNEWDQRNSGLQFCHHHGIDYTVIIDTDEIYDPGQFAALKNYVSSAPDIHAFHLNWVTYWTEDFYRIDPPEQYWPLVVVKSDHFLFTGIRGGISCVRLTASGYERDGDPEDYYKHSIVVPAELVLCHHLSYVRDDQYMRRKLETNSHAKEFIVNWYHNVWKAWTPEMRNLHPIHPEQYQQAVPQDPKELPKVLRDYIEERQRQQRP